MRLINADALKEELTSHFDLELEPVIEKEVLRMIDEQKTILVKPPKWISVKDRLPEADGEVVLACYQPRKPNYIFFAYFNGSWAIYQPTEDGLLYSHPVRVSHWMPLPEPPEVEDVQG